MSRYSQTIRILKLLRLLASKHPRGFTLHDLAKKLDVTKRTIYRDLDFLMEQKLVTTWKKETANETTIFIYRRGIL